jgi:Protein of unknown function (DUF3667)
MQNCNNCSNDVQGKYCSHCGQKAGVGRLSLHEIFHELVHSVTHTEKGILKLTKELFIRPRRVYNGYFLGKRKTYFSPVMFFLLAIGLLIFFGDKLFDREMELTGDKNLVFQKFLHHYQKIRYLIFIPVISTITWLFFYQRYNFSECLVFWFFCTGFISVVEIFSYLPQYFFVHHRYVIRYITDWLAWLIILWHLLLVFSGRQLRGVIKSVFLAVLAYFILVYILNYFAYLNGIDYSFNPVRIFKEVF